MFWEGHEDGEKKSVPSRSQIEAVRLAETPSPAPQAPIQQPVPRSQHSLVGPCLTWP
jgi:hypothetical protein